MERIADCSAAEPDCTAGRVDENFYVGRPDFSLERSVFRLRWICTLIFNLVQLATAIDELALAAGELAACSGELAGIRIFT